MELEFELRFDGFMSRYLTKRKSQKFFKNSSYPYICRNYIYSYANANATFAVNKYSVAIYIHEDNENTYELIKDYISKVFTKNAKFIANNLWLIDCNDTDSELYKKIINSNKS